MDLHDANQSQPVAPTFGGPVASDPFDIIAAQVDALAQIAPRDLTGTGAMEFFDRAFELSDRLHALAAQVLPVVEADGRWALDPSGPRTFTNWLIRRAHVTHAKAKRMARLGRALRDELPLTGAAVIEAGPGRIGIDQAEILTTVAATSEARRRVLTDPDHECGEEFLLEQARTQPADTLRSIARTWAAAADPETDERGYKEATEREFFNLDTTTGGCHLTGFLTTEHGQALLIAMDAVGGKPVAGDDRSPAQRRAGALTDLARTALDQGLVGKGAIVRPHLNILIDYSTLITLATIAGVAGLLPYAAGPLDPAVFEDGQPVPRAVLERLMCDSTISRIIFGPDSQLINVGRSKRLFPRRLRRAIINRDKHCQFPGCTAPPRLCEAHHRKHWVRDHGDTDATNGVLLCWHHHTHVHDKGIEIQWNPAPKNGLMTGDSNWTFIDRHGHPLRI